MQLETNVGKQNLVSKLSNKLSGSMQNDSNPVGLTALRSRVSMPDRNRNNSQKSLSSNESLGSRGSKK